MNTNDVLNKLIAEIERRKKSINECPFIEAKLGASIKRDAKIKTFNELLSLIDSLQQNEKAVEIEMCSQAYWEERGWMMIPPDVTLKGIESLLEQVRKKLQQAQPQVADASKMVQPVEGLEELRKEVIKFSQDHFDELHSDMETIDIVHIIACHFAEWGAAHARKEE